MLLSLAIASCESSSTAPTLSGKWSELTPTDSGPIVFYPCDVHVESIRIYENDNHRSQLDWDYGVDTGIFYIRSETCSDTVCILEAVEAISNESCTFRVKKSPSGHFTYWSSSSDHYKEIELFADESTCASLPKKKQSCDSSFAIPD
jgi:hypothetical protein